MDGISKDSPQGTGDSHKQHEEGAKIPPVQFVEAPQDVTHKCKVGCLHMQNVHF